LNPDVLVPVGAMLAFIAAIYVATAKLLRLRATLRESPSVETAARLEALEREVEDLHQELAATQERLDFTERLLSQARDERRLGSS